MARLEQEAYRLAAKALAQQERELTELRARTGTLFTASSFITSFAGGRALSGGGLDVWVVLAVIAFGISLVLSIYVLLPKEELAFALEGAVVYEALYEVRDDEEEVDWGLASALEAARHANHPIVRRIMRAFETAGIALLAEILFLAVELL
jgi:hypothetical protein